MTKAEFVAKVAEGAGVSKAEADKVIKSVFGEITDALKVGDKIIVPDFGTFLTRERAERIGVNPQTGETITIPKQTVAAFKPSKVLKDALK